MPHKAKVHVKRNDDANPADKDPGTKSVVTTFYGMAMNRIMIFRVLLALSLLVTGIVSGVMSHVLLRQRENEKYKSEFHSTSDEVYTAVNEGFTSKRNILEAMSTMLSYRCPDAVTWPNCSMPLDYFQDVTSSFVELSKAMSVDSNPLVRPDQQAGFEAFAYEMFEREGFPEDTGVSPFGRGIYASDENGTRYHDDGMTSFSHHDVLLPVFQPAFVKMLWRAVMFNMHSEPTRAASIDEVIDCVAARNSSSLGGESIVHQCTATTDFILPAHDTTTASPFSLMFAPILPHNDNTTLVGINTIVFEWSAVLASSRTNFGHLHCVVESSRGGQVVSEKHFDLHNGDTEFICDDCESERDLIKNQISKSYDILCDTDSGGLEYKITFYTTDDFIRQFHTNVPIYGSVACAVIIVLISSLFISYDVLVNRESLENRMLLESKRIFVKFISHEIRTPINTVTLGLQLLSTRLSDMIASDTARHRASDSCSSPVSAGEAFGRSSSFVAGVEECLDLVDDLTESSGTAVLVLNDLINYDKVELKKFHVERKLCNVYAVLKSTVQPQELLARTRDVQLVAEEYTDKAYVIGDEMKLGQVIRNVLSNALKFTPPQGTVNVSVAWDKLAGSSDDLEPRYDPSTGDEYNPAGIVTIRVTDTGPGLSAEQQEKMFQEGVQFNPNELQGGGGSGLGLWISREIIQQHGGTIGVSSEGLGKGSTFIISLPVLLPSTTKSRRYNSVRNSVRTSVRNSRSCQEIDVMNLQLTLRVLVVDDAKSNAKILSRLLESAGMKVTIASNGEEGVKKVKECAQGDHAFDMVVMDYVMPVMNGPDATRVLRAAGYMLPIIGLTGNVQTEDIQCFMAAGANMVFPKPLNWCTLLEACRELALTAPETNTGTERSIRNATPSMRKPRGDENV
mmetsp:Transcript_14008/g.23205  ORF Transcript_14008/g.23205 Transcript_14008/m.23205 type:complete len:907 (+) Transcript_14008:70-2790(+)